MKNKQWLNSLKLELETDKTSKIDGFLHAEWVRSSMGDDVLAIHIVRTPALDLFNALRETIDLKGLMNGRVTLPDKEVLTVYA